MACVDKEAHVLIHGTQTGKMRDAALSADLGKILSVIMPLLTAKALAYLAQVQERALAR